MTQATEKSGAKNQMTLTEPTMVEMPSEYPVKRPGTTYVADVPPVSTGASVPIPTETVKNIAIAIAGVMKEVGIVSKRGLNQFHHYKYASMQDVLQKITPLLAKHGLIIMQNEIGRSMFDSDRTIAIQYAFTIFHTSGEVWPERPVQTGMSRCRDSRGGFDEKSINKCHTAARKYFLLSLFQIATGDEDDADNEKPIGPPPSRTIKTRPTRIDADGVIQDDEQFYNMNDALPGDLAPPDSSATQDSTPVRQLTDKAGASSEAGAPAEDFVASEQYQIRWRSAIKRAVPTDWQRLGDDWNRERAERNRIQWPDTETFLRLQSEVKDAIAFLKDGGGL